MSGKHQYIDLCRMKKFELEKVFKNGVTPDFAKLAGWEFRGTNVAELPKLLGFQKFMKGFFHKNGEPFGYNIKVEQNGLIGDWIYAGGASEPKRFGFYSVKSVNPNSPDNKEPRALLLNYGEAENGIFEGANLRDYLMQVDPENPDLYIGAAYMAVGPLRIFSNYFIIERYKESWMK